MQTQIFGHRGFKAKYPENTLLSFEKALDLGVDGIELDIHYSKDGELIVFHDFDLKRMTKVEGNVFDFTYLELSKLNVQYKGFKEGIPRLKDVIALIKQKESTLIDGRKISLNVEFKAGSQFYFEIEKKALELCFKDLEYRQVVFSSFDHYALKEIKSLDRNALTGMLTASSMVDPWLYMSHINADYYHPNYLALTPPNLTGLIENKVKTSAYTVNDQSVAKQLMTHKINAIITDYPNLMLKVRKHL